MTDLLDKQEREKELRDFDAVWPGDDPLSIIRDFRATYKEATGLQAPAVTQKDGVYTVHFNDAGGDQEFTAEQIKDWTKRGKAKAKLAGK